MRWPVPPKAFNLCKEFNSQKRQYFINLPAFGKVELRPEPKYSAILPMVQAIHLMPDLGMIVFKKKFQ